ncbi:MAG: glucose 1-dehydrogenase [Alphaproteobacteria bacterium]
MKLFDLTGKVALVTGGNSGIGLGMARGLAEAGATVAIAARDQERAKSVLPSLGDKAISVATDVTDPTAIENMVAATVDQLGGVDILVNNAGTNIRGRPEDMKVADWHTVIDTNLTSAFLASQAVYPHMKKAGGGKIMNNGSMASIFGLPFAAAYGASKGGMVQMTKSLATAWAVDNIQVNCFLPGWIDTPLTQRARQQLTELHDNVLRRTPAGRWGAIEDFAGIAVFLASAASDFVTGTAIEVDGGYASLG